MGLVVQQDSLPCRKKNYNQEFKTVGVWNSHLVSIPWPDFYARLEISVNQDITH